MPSAEGPVPHIETGAGIVENEQTAALFTRRALAALHRFGFAGALVWCFSDYDETLWRVPPLDQAVHERHFGLWRIDGSTKPALEEIRRFSGLDRRPLRPDLTWIDITPCEFWSEPAFHVRRLYCLFLKHHWDFLQAVDESLA